VIMAVGPNLKPGIIKRESLLRMGKNENDLQSNGFIGLERMPFAQRPV
jgi:hypothetical protein